MKTLPSPTASQTIILEVARRYRVVTPGSLAVLQDYTETAAEKALRRLDQRGWLHQLRLPQRQICYTLSRNAVLLLGLSKKAMKTMGQAAVITNLAMTYFCGRQKVERLTQEEIRATYQQLFF
jgi:DNA-binding transcriptional regulator PaaX